MLLRELLLDCLLLVDGEGGDLEVLSKAALSSGSTPATLPVLRR